MAQITGTYNKDIAPSVDALHTAARFHGIGTIFGEDCALERTIMAAFVKPSGILDLLPAVPTNYELIRYGAITGWQPDSEPEPDYPCENAPRGTYSTCRLEFELGRIKRDSETIEIDVAIERAHRGDEEFFLQGRMVGNALGNFASGPFPTESGDALNVTTILQLQSIALAFAIELGRMVWIGDPTAPDPANTPNGGKKSFAGFELLVTDTVIDAVTSNPCPSMGSQVYDWLYEDVCDGVIALPPAPATECADYNIAQLLSISMHKMETLAMSSYLAPVVGVWVFNPSLWFYLTECYTCQYHTNRCLIPETMFVNDYAVRERDLLRDGMYLPINGKNYPVVLDWGLPVQDATTTPLELTGNERASDIYFIPLRIMDNIPVTWMRYKDYRRAAPERNALTRGGAFPTPYVWTDDGKFMISYEFVNFCYKLTAKIEPGLVFRAPQFAIVIRNVKWCDAVPLRSPYPDSADFVIDTLV